MSRTVLHRSQRRLARTILVLIAGLLSTFVFFSTGPLRGFSVAQTPTSRFEIQFINASGYSSGNREEISAKSDNSDGPSENGYHLVAWVNELPGNPVVEFRYRDPSTQSEVVIGTATQTAIPDTFELYWDPPASVTDGSLTMHALLFDGSTEVARDTETDQTLNDSDSPSPRAEVEPRAETIELTYPTSSGTLGVFRPRDGSNAAVVLNATWSDGTTYIRGFYTTSAPGTEPVWTVCTGGNLGDISAANGDPNNGFLSPTVGIICTLAAAVEPEEVTAVALIANDSPEDPSGECCGMDPAEDDAGDAHRVASYFQIPTTVALSPEIQNEQVLERCSGSITATVTDQNGRAIYRANVDAHAKGPEDTLAFDSAHSRPTQGGHRTESAIVCAPGLPAPPGSPPAPGGQQGEHDDATGPDLKHVEGATSVIGQRAFRLYSPTRGATQIAIWSEFDDDDLRCSEEASANAVIGWQEPAPAATGLPLDLQTCPDPTPSTPDTPTPTDTETTPPDPRGCTITGTEQGESLDGTPDRDVICGLGGKDIIRGLGGNDVIYGDGGNDDLRGGDGSDLIEGAAGKDTLTGGNGEDILRGLLNNDTVVGGEGSDRLTGNGGIDTLRGNGGADRLDGGPRDDVLTGGGGGDVLLGRGGDDVLTGGAQRDRCRGGAGTDETRSCET